MGGSLCLSGSVIFNERLQVETSSTIDWILWGINDQTRLQQLQLNNQSRLRLSNRGSEMLQKRSTTTVMITSSQYSMYRISTNILSLRPCQTRLPIPMRSISFPYELSTIAGYTIAADDALKGKDETGDPGDITSKIGSDPIFQHGFKYA